MSIAEKSKEGKITQRSMRKYLRSHLSRLPMHRYTKIWRAFSRDYLKRRFVSGVNSSIIAAQNRKRSPIFLLAKLYKLFPETLRTNSQPFVHSALRRFGIQPRGARCYVRPDVSRVYFINELNRRGIKYVLLRWWMNFPEYPTGEDMDILMPHEDRNRIQDLLVSYPTDIPCDIYTVNGEGQGHYQGIPYFPPTLSERILSECVLYRDSVYIPSERLYFASLAYHAIYHKGNRSGLQGFSVNDEEPEHNYNKILQHIADSIGLDIETSVDSLVSWLTKEGFAPSTDTLMKLIDINDDLSFLYETPPFDISGGELCVFIIRERAEKEGLTEIFLEHLEKDKRIEILRSILLDAEQKKVCTMHLRGGKWDKGPYPHSGGSPARIIVAFDYHPKPLTSEQLKKYKWFSNRNVLEFKLECRKILSETHFYTNLYNPVHSADNEPVAFNYIKIAIPEEIEEITQEIACRRKRYASDHPVVEILSEGRRSKVELVDFYGKIAVKKTFRVGMDRFLDRELYAYKELSKKCAFIPPLLWEGNGSFIIPFFNNVLVDLKEKDFRQIMRSHKDDIYDVIHMLYKHGLAYIDFRPGNVIITQEGQFLAIDYEFLQPYAMLPTSVNEAYEVRGIPIDFSGDLPFGLGTDNSSFDYIWAKYIGKWETIKNDFK